MNKYFLIFIVSIIFAAACVSFRGLEKYQPGIYEGAAEGYGGSIVVKVETDKTSILDISIVSENEYPFIGAEALFDLMEMVLENDSTDIDAVSGATITSDGFCKAVNNALLKAAIVKP